MPSRLIKKIEIFFKKALHLPFALIFADGKRSRIPVNPENINSILILRQDKLGDMIVTIPVIHAIKERFPHIKIEVLASPKNKIIIENDPGVDSIHLYRKNILKDVPLMLKLRKKKFDIVFDAITLDSVTGLILTKIIGRNSIKVASRKSDFHRYYDFCERHLPEGTEHNIDNNILIFKVFGCDPQNINPFQPVYLPDSSRRISRDFYKMMPNQSCYFVGLNISAGSATRTLSIEKHLSIINDINRKRPDIKFIIFSVMAEREKARFLKDSADGEVFLIPDNISLLDAAAILSELDLLISPDTSMIHIARLMRIPVVGLYSGHARNYYSWKPYRQEHGSVIAANISNIFDIEPGDVVKEFEKVLNDSKNSLSENSKA